MFDRWHGSMVAVPDTDVKYMLLLLPLLLKYAGGDFRRHLCVSTICF